MDIRIIRCKRSAKCRYCEQPITKGEPMVAGKLFKNTYQEQGRRNWTMYFYWHAQRAEDGGCCWLDDGIARLDTPEATKLEAKRGRKPLTLSPEDKKLRFKILARRARVVQRLLEEMYKPECNRSMDRIIHLGSQIEKQKEEIEPLGGVPKSWM